MIRLIDKLWRRIGQRHFGRVARIVERVQLTPDTFLHVVDVDGRRYVFATAPNAVGLLAQYETSASGPNGEEGTLCAV